jgi:hypothetical protein
VQAKREAEEDDTRPLFTGRNDEAKAQAKREAEAQARQTTASLQEQEVKEVWAHLQTCGFKPNIFLLMLQKLRMEAQLNPEVADNDICYDILQNQSDIKSMMDHLEQHGFQLEKLLPEKNVLNTRPATPQSAHDDEQDDDNRHHSSEQNDDDTKRIKRKKEITSSKRRRTFPAVETETDSETGDI